METYSSAGTYSLNRCPAHPNAYSSVQLIGLRRTEGAGIYIQGYSNRSSLSRCTAPVTMLLVWLLVAMVTAGTEGCARQAEAPTNLPTFPPTAPTPLPPAVTPLPPVVTPLPPVVTPLPPVVTPLPPVVTPLPSVVTPLPPVVEEVVAAATAARHENAWVTGGGIDWGRVAPGGSSHHGSASSSSHGSASSSNGGSTEHGSSSGGSSNANAPTSPQPVSRGELRDLAEELYRLDTDGATARAIVNPQGRTSSASTADHAPQNLFTSVSPRALSSPTFAALLVLLDNYEASVLQAEQDTFHERQEQDDFLQAVMATKIMARAEQFLTSKGLIISALKDVLREIWFTTYSRSRRTLGSSGFEHVFVGETKNGEVSGFHNWVNFYIQEQEGHLDYFGHMKTVDLGDHAQIILLKFKWVDEAKPYGSMLVGTSPEFDLALYTVCFFARPGANCPVKVNGHNFNIKTYYQDYRGKRYVGTAFPNI